MDLAQRWGVTIIFPKVHSFTWEPHTQKRKMIWWLSLIRQRSQNIGLGSNTVNLKELNPNQYFSTLLWIMLLLNAIIKKKDFENLFFPILWTDLNIFWLFFLLKLNSMVFYVWAFWMDPNGKNCVFTVWFFHPKRLSSAKWESYKIVKQSICSFSQKQEW